MTNYADLAKDARDCREAAKRARRFDDRIGCDVGGIYLRRGSFGPERSSGPWEPNRLSCLDGQGCDRRPRLRAGAVKHSQQ